jgi:hypothetical protein
MTPASAEASPAAAAIRREQLGVDPGLERADLHQAVLARDTTLDLSGIPLIPPEPEHVRVDEARGQVGQVVGVV